MNRVVNQIATMFAVVGMMTAGAAFAQQAVTAAAEPATAAATHNEPIVQKRMEVRQANREQRARTAEARQNFRAEARNARSERNQTVQEARANAATAFDAQQPAHRANP